MTSERFTAITSLYPRLSIAVVGDFCLDRYFEIDPARQEVSIETGLPVHNVINIRSQPGGAGTILNNLCALGVGAIYPVGFAGEDGEGHELFRALSSQPGVHLDHFFPTRERHTFTYGKPLIVAPGNPPRELNRLDRKNWTPSPPTVVKRLQTAVTALVEKVNAFALLEQVDQAETGVLTSAVLATIGELAKSNPAQVIVADSRRSLRNFPPVTVKMNAAELASLAGVEQSASLPEIAAAAVNLARRNNRSVVVTLSERGILAATPDGEVEHVPNHPLRGEIDIVGAGDAVLANLTTALAAGASLREAVDLANAAASVVIHQLGTTGTASVGQLRELLFK